MPLSAYARSSSCKDCLFFINSAHHIAPQHIEYGRDQEALYLTPMLFYQDDIVSVTSLEEVDGPFGHYSEKYGLLERKCLEWGSDLIEEVLASEDDTQIRRMLACMKDHLQALAERAVPGMAPWRSGNSVSESEVDEDELGPVYMGELENMLETLVKYSGNDEVVREARELLERLSRQNFCNTAEDAYTG